MLAIDLECGLPPDRSFLLFPADESDGTSSILCGSLSCTCGFELVVDNIGRGGGGRLSLRHEAELLAMGLAMGDGTFCREHYAVSSQVSAVRRFSRREKNRFFEITEISVTTLEQTTIGQTSTISEPTLRFVALVHFVAVRFLFCGWPVSLFATGPFSFWLTSPFWSSICGQNMSGRALLARKKTQSSFRVSTGLSFPSPKRFPSI